MIRLTVYFTVLCLPLLIGQGCSSLVSSPPKSRPYFSLDPSESKALHSMAKRQEALLLKCAENNSCEHAYFVRALIGLYESRELASKYFEKVINTAPRGQLAASSRVWLKLIQERPAPVDRSWVDSVMSAPAISEGHATLGQATDRLVRDLLDNEVAIQHLRLAKDADAQTIDMLQRELNDHEHKIESLLAKKEQSKMPDFSTVQALQKQLSERDKKIDELTSQLEALKRIDQEMREKVRPIRPPSTVITPPIPEPTNP